MSVAEECTWRRGTWVACRWCPRVARRRGAIPCNQMEGDDGAHVDLAQHTLLRVALLRIALLRVALLLWIPCGALFV